MKAVVVLSGGMDSAAALGKAVMDYGKENVETITFNYGSKHNERENGFAKQLSDHFGVKNTLVYLPFVNELFKSDLLKSGGEVPEGHYADENMKKTVVPFRNGIMLSIAAGYAESIDAEFVVLGNHAGDHTIYPDCRSDFIGFMDAAIKAGTWKGIQIFAPFVALKKSDIVVSGGLTGVPFEKTYSCYKGGEKHCGKCGTCVERKEAFRDAKTPDPTEYEDAAYEPKAP